MCGIFGVVVADRSQVSDDEIGEVLRTLFRLSETRGKESAGIVGMAFGGNRILLSKSPLSPSEFIKSGQPRRVIDEVLGDASSEGHGFAVIGHSRMVTNGTQYSNLNNQPVTSGKVALVHNGIVTNVEALWEAEPYLTRSSQVDSELLAARFNAALEDEEQSIESGTRAMFVDMEGAASVAALAAERSAVVLATNTGSLYVAKSRNDNTIVFASEEFILNKLIEKRDLKAKWGLSGASRVEPGNACSVVNVDDKRLCMTEFDLIGAIASRKRMGSTTKRYDFVDYSAPFKICSGAKPSSSISSLLYEEERIRNLTRCTNCILPTTFPYIEFDSQGVCNYCQSYQVKSVVLGSWAFREIMEKYRRKPGQLDCIVAFSGGRDSSYGLHLLKREFELNPITFTYDWGMVTDLARRNIARVCGKLGIENILVSADIDKKRSNIRKNLNAWIASPHLGLIPLLMAGDKYFFRYMNVVKRQSGIDLNIWCTNNLENTEFKVGLCGIRPKFVKDRIDSLSVLQKSRLVLFYGTKFLTNPRFLNSSLEDTFGAFWTYYLEKRSDYFLLFDYVPWEEEEVNRTLIGEYNWEVSPDSESTWRIGDGTAAFYNYCYVSVLGFSEFDTFLSNQVREGMLTREEAMRRVVVDNRPRSESLRWYLATVGLEPNGTINALNSKLVGMRNWSEG